MEVNDSVSVRHSAARCPPLQSIAGHRGALAREPLADARQPLGLHRLPAQTAHSR